MFMECVPLRFTMAILKLGIQQQGLRGRLILLIIINIQMSKEVLCFGTMNKVPEYQGIQSTQDYVGYIL
ncbi:hypothetical protein SDC9_163364 [bioreactor metagenome]|uniref:Uncharacterized protein n=1 Tax=bioreactor metagenome TaxID=1076179 RepID=A0A645FQN5_9ZZZZ